MPQIRNKHTGHTQNVSNEAIVKILGNPMTKNLFDVTSVKEPAELRNRTQNLTGATELERLNKTQLQAKYKEVFESDPDESLTKANLLKAIVEKMGSAETSGDQQSEQ